MEFTRNLIITLDTDFQTQSHYICNYMHNDLIKISIYIHSLLDYAIIQL